MAGYSPMGALPEENIHDKYDFLDLLGKGSFGTVYLCVDKNSGERRAIKKIDLDDTESSASKSFTGLRKVKKEAGILKSLNHPNIVQFFDFICETEDVCFIVTEYCEDGDLRKVIISARQPGIQRLQSEVFKWSREILNAVAYLHSNNIIHRDIKPANILLQNNTIKLGDFGLSRFYLTDELLMSYAGTKLYMAPEVFTGKGYTNSADIWSVGCVLYELFYLKKACKKGPTPPTAFLDPQVPSFNNAIKRMLQTNPESRPSATGAIEIMIDRSGQDRPPVHLKPRQKKSRGSTSTLHMISKRPGHSYSTRSYSSVAASRGTTSEVQVPQTLFTNRFNGKNRF